MSLRNRTFFGSKSATPSAVTDEALDVQTRLRNTQDSLCWIVDKQRRFEIAFKKEVAKKEKFEDGYRRKTAVALELGDEVSTMKKELNDYCVMVQNNLSHRIFGNLGARLTNTGGDLYREVSENNVTKYAFLKMFEGRDIVVKKQKRKVHGESVDVDILYLHFYDPVDAHNALQVDTKDVDGSIVWLSPRVHKEGGWFACASVDGDKCTVVQGRMMEGGGGGEELRDTDISFKDRTVELRNCVVQNYTNGTDVLEKWAPVTVSLNTGSGVLSVKWQTSYIRSDTCCFIH